MSLGDEIQVTLASNVKSNARNKPPDFETALAKPLELPGVWEVALIDFSYPHNWVNLDKPIYFSILTNPTCVISEMLLDYFEQREYQDIYRAMISLQGLACMWVSLLVD